MKHSTSSRLLWLALMLPAAFGGQIRADEAGAEESVPYVLRREQFQTKLVKKGPAPRAFANQTPLEGVHEVAYPSGNLRLKAWVQSPPNPRRRKLPAVVYFHSEFAFNANHFKAALPFVQAGFIVMTPMLRGENGNPGNCEMFLGEVDDAAAAVKWLARHDVVDRRRIYTFGHSAGGVISALLSLRDDVPIRHGGSSGGLYGTELFRMIADRVPFDLDDPQECQMRVLPGNIRWMKRKHYAYIGTHDLGVMGGVRKARKEMESISDPKLTIISHPGQHSSALAPAIEQYIKLLKSDP